MSLAENIVAVQERILQATKGENPATKLPRIIAVSKTRTVSDIRAVHEAGLRDFGENYLQEALEKIDATQDLDLHWHFIGPIQSNKTAAIATHFDWVQSVDRLKIAQRLNNQRPADKTPLNICLQVNADHETNKSGLHPDELISFAKKLVPFNRLRLRGIMAIPARKSEHAAQLEAAHRIAAMYHRLRQVRPEVDTLSLGMSGDLEAAVLAGSNMLRIGTDIFGSRNQ